MSKRTRSLWKNPGARLAGILLILWSAAWVVFLGIKPDVRLAGLPVISWCQLLLGALGVVCSLVAIPLFGRWERR